MFRNWYCPDCRSHLRRFGDVKRRTEFMGLYTAYWYICLNCGSRNAMPFKTYLKVKASEGAIE